MLFKIKYFQSKSSLSSSASSLGITNAPGIPIRLKCNQLPDGFWLGT
jgi:hypothetical protein